MIIQYKSLKQKMCEEYQKCYIFIAVFLHLTTKKEIRELFNGYEGLDQ
jgi:dimeric dUTPase (all-alpha-NTP-PPase superfamily)